VKKSSLLAWQSLSCRSVQIDKRDWISRVLTGHLCFTGLAQVKEYTWGTERIRFTSQPHGAFAPIPWRYIALLFHGGVLMCTQHLEQLKYKVDG
jgi:hypothetical protein